MRRVEPLPSSRTVADQKMDGGALEFGHFQNTDEKSTKSGRAMLGREAEGGDTSSGYERTRYR